MSLYFRARRLVFTAAFFLVLTAIYRLDPFHTPNRDVMYFITTVAMFIIILFDLYYFIIKMVGIVLWALRDDENEEVPS